MERIAVPNASRAWFEGGRLSMKVGVIQVIATSFGFPLSSLDEMAGVALHDAVEVPDDADLSAPTPPTVKCLSDGFLKKILGFSVRRVQPPLPREAARNQHQLGEVRLLEISDGVMSLFARSVPCGFGCQGHWATPIYHQRPAGFRPRSCRSQGLHATSYCRPSPRARTLECAFSAIAGASAAVGNIPVPSGALPGTPLANVRRCT